MMMMIFVKVLCNNIERIPKFWEKTLPQFRVVQFILRHGTVLFILLLRIFGASRDVVSSRFFLHSLLYLMVQEGFRISAQTF